MKYEPIPRLTEDEIESAIARNNPNELLYAVLSAALHSNDPDWAERVCIRLAAHPHFNVRGNAILGFGHIARIHGRLSRETVKPLIVNALSDESEYVRGQANDAADDARHFLKWRFKRS